MNPPALRLAVLGEADVVRHGLADIFGSDAVVRAAHEFDGADVCLWNPHGQLVTRLGLDAATALARRCAPVSLAITMVPERVGTIDVDGVVDMRADAPTVRAAVLARTPVVGIDLPDQLVPVARLLMAGRTNTEMAQLLYLSESTVVRRLRDLYRELGVDSRITAISRLAGAGGSALAS